MPSPESSEDLHEKERHQHTFLSCKQCIAYFTAEHCSKYMHLACPFIFETGPCRFYYRTIPGLLDHIFLMHMCHCELCPEQVFTTVASLAHHKAVIHASPKPTIPAAIKEEVNEDQDIKPSSPSAQPKSSTLNARAPEFVHPFTPTAANRRPIIRTNTAAPVITATAPIIVTATALEADSFDPFGSIDSEDGPMATLFPVLAPTSSMKSNNDTSASPT